MLLTPPSPAGISFVTSAPRTALGATIACTRPAIFPQSRPKKSLCALCILRGEKGFYGTHTDQAFFLPAIKWNFAGSRLRNKKEAMGRNIQCKP